MKRRVKVLVDVEIDKLTNSIENTASGDVFDTAIIQLFFKDSSGLRKAEWRFNWKDQLKLKDRGNLQTRY